MMEMDPVNPVKLPDVTLQIHRYGRMMQLLALANAAMCASALVLSLTARVHYEIALYILFSFVIFALLFFSFRRGHLNTGFYSLMYFSSLTGLAGNNLLGWRSGFFVLLFLLIPAFFYNPLLRGAAKTLLGIFFAAIVTVTILFSFLVEPVIFIPSFQLQIMNGVNISITCLALALIACLDYRSFNAVARNLVELNHKLAYQASRDPLTDLLNRRTMVNFIENEHARSRRSGKPFGLILTDIDDFKLVNDQYGHTAGDIVLMELANLLRIVLRQQDLIARWGGEEFLILLPETDYEGVQVAAEKIREIVAKARVVHQGNPIQVTFSIGGVVCQLEENWDECIILADRALYFGKNHGKNLAVFAKGDLYCVLGSSQEAEVTEVS